MATSVTPRTVLRSRTLLFMVGSAAIAFLLGSFLFARDESEEAKGQTVATAAQAQMFAAQVRGACEARALSGPVCQQAAEVAKDPIPVPGPATPGRDGEDGTDGQDGADGLPGISVPGRDGRDGRDGEDGADGEPGADATPVPGRDGTDGAPGAPGQPPAGFGFTTPDGTTYSCPRDPTSPDTAAYYPCQITSGPDPTPEPTTAPEPTTTPPTEGPDDGS